MSKLADREWMTLLEIVAEATDQLTNEEHAFALKAVADGELAVLDYGQHITVKVGGKRLVSVDRMLLSKPVGTTPTNN